MLHGRCWVWFCCFLRRRPCTNGNLSSLSHTPCSKGGLFFLVVALFSLLVMMSGEIFVASSHLASTKANCCSSGGDENVGGLVPAWWLLMAQTELFTQGWWERPGHDSRMHAAALIATYASMMVFFHASYP